VEEILGMIFALFDALAKRAGDARKPVAQALREALAERAGPPGVAAVPASPPARAAVSSSASPGAPIAGAGPAVAGAGPAMRVRPAAQGAAPSAEAGLVRGLFASPQSLVAAFIVAEVLAKPVTLRDH